MFNNELLRLLIKLFDDLSFNQEIVQNEHKWKLGFFFAGRKDTTVFNNWLAHNRKI